MDPREPYQICDPVALGKQLAAHHMGESVETEWWKYYEEYLIWEMIRGPNSDFRADLESGISNFLADVKHLWCI